MSWKTVSQAFAAAVVGVAIFEAGRMSAYRDFLHVGGELTVASSSEPLRQPRIFEMTTRPRPAPATSAATGEVVQASSGKTEFRRKKHADPPLAARDKEIVTASELLVEKGDYETARRLAASAVKTSRREVREAAVAMLGWFGKMTIAELTPFLADSDDGVAMEAAAHWKRIFANECNEREKLEVAALVMNRLTSETMLDDLGVEDMFNEVDEVAAVEVLIGVIKTGTPAGVKLAKTAYDTVTGEEWKDEASARQWMKENAEGV